MKRKFFAILSTVVTVPWPCAYGQFEFDQGPLDDWSIVDLSQTLSEQSPVYPGSQTFKARTLAQLDNSIFYMRSFSMSEHCGTHIDAPSHKSKDGLNVDSLGLARFYGPLVIINVEEESKLNPDFVVELDHIRHHEREFGEIPTGAFVVANTGWWKKWDDKEAYVNLGEDGKPHFPGFSPMATTFLLKERMIAGMGIDTLSTDPGISVDFPQHQIFLGGGGINLENVGNLAAVPARGAFLLATPLKLKKGSGAPARVVAFVRKELAVRNDEKLPCPPEKP